MYPLIAKAIRISHAKFHCNGLIIIMKLEVERRARFDVHDVTCTMFKITRLTHSVYTVLSCAAACYSVFPCNNLQMSNWFPIKAYYYYYYYY